MLPGEAAPRLALAACAELASQNDVAVGHYATVWATDRAYVSAAFGLSRARCALGDLANAIAALREVPETASLHRDAQLGAITALLRGSDARTLTYPELSDAGQRLGALRLDPTTRAEVAAELLTVTLERVELVDKGDLPPDPFAQRLTVLDHPLAERDLRFALESCYRDIAHHATTRELRISAVDRANAVRPRTWW
jgi:serine/threonine-protein kinase PknG